MLEFLKIWIFLRINLEDLAFFARENKRKKVMQFHRSEYLKRALANWKYLPMVKVEFWLKNEPSKQCISWLTFLFPVRKKLSHVSSKYRKNFHYKNDTCFTDLRRHLTLSIYSTSNFMKLVLSRQNFGITDF